MKNLKLVLIAAFTICISVSFAQTKNVLFLGNSYTGVNNLPLLTYNLALSLGDTINYDSNTPGGYTYQGHSTNATSLAKIAQGNWDFVVLQEQSQKPSFPPSQVATDVYPYALILVDSIKSANACAEPLFYMTWGRKNGDAGNCASYPPLCTYDGMQGRLRESYMEMSVDNDCSVSPVGAAWKYVRDNYPTIELYSADESHPSINGSYLAACVHYASMYRESPVGASFISTVTAIDAAILQEAAELVVLDSLSAWRIGDNDVVASFTSSTISGGTTFSENGTNGTTYSWDLDDGSIETAASFSYTYANDGVYNVELIATNGCDSDTVSQQVTINTAGISENKLEVIVYKVQNDYTLTFTNSTPRKLQLYDTKGGLLLASSSNQCAIKITIPQAGMYILHVVESDKSAVIKLINH
jgi:PKD repeat protein